MILDSIDRFKAYTAVNKRFITAFKFLKRPGFNELKPGTYEIEGRDLFVSIYAGGVKVAPKLEAHRKYIDIQYLIKGREVIGWKGLSECKSVLSRYDKVRDIIFFKDKPGSLITLEPGSFVVFFPQDTHAPLLEGTKHIKKAVFKIRV